ncbi:MAG: 8-amino-7-oxononanoate synthase [Pseudomonadota bacterium]|nr:8-amino-7-oxononanoate synthase [Pseudomonadota bacterium]
MADSYLKTAITARLRQIKAHDNYRSLRSPLSYPDGEDFIDLSHNDYLSLRADKNWQAELWEHCRGLPCGAGGSRLLGGEFFALQELEAQFAEFKCAPAALYFNSGYAANEACLPALAVALEDSHFFSDARNHASIIDGFRLAKIPANKRTIYPHLDMNALEHGLRQSSAKLNVIITESIFSMDGDMCDLPLLMSLVARYRGLLVVDEAHAVGVRGERGAGLIEEQGIAHEQIISINTCGKALGVCGAFVCSPVWFKDYLINTARPFIFTTAPSPWIAAALSATLPRIQQLNFKRTQLRLFADHIRAELRAKGFDTGKSCTQIIPVLATSSTQALSWSKELARQGIIAPAIRPPTVAQPRLRLSVSV